MLNAKSPLVSIPIGFDVQQRERTVDTGQGRRRRRVQIGAVELGETGSAEQAKAPDHFILKQLQHAQHPGFPCRGERPALQASDADEIRAHDDRLDDIAAPAE